MERFWLCGKIVGKKSGAFSGKKQEGQSGHSCGGAPNKGKQGKVFVGIGSKDAGFGVDHVADEVEGEVTA